MSYQVLARKWRPAQFDQVVGQQHVLTPLKHALDNNRLHHAYLFTGTRGVGKTTIARILAKSLNCAEGVTSTPCGKCQACLDIDQGRFVDLLEIDAASRTKVEDTRELLDNVQYRPTQGRYKVYLIDEVHMLSRHSFNALLKTLEEPPEHVKFLLATTDPQKLPVTVVSRCLQFNLRALTPDLISGQLSHVLQQEHIPFQPDALTLLARAARGSMRDGLSLTDQAIAQGAGEVQTATVQQMLGSLPETDVVSLLLTIANNDQARVFEQLDAMASVVPDIGAILTGLQSLLHRLALVQQLPQMASESEQQAQFQALLRELPAEVIQVYYRFVLDGRKELAYAVDERSGVEMTLLRLLAFIPYDAEFADDELSAGELSGDKSAGEKSNSDTVKEDPVSAPVSADRPTQEEPPLPEDIPPMAGDYEDNHEELRVDEHVDEHFNDGSDRYANHTETKQPTDSIEDLLKTREQLANANNSAAEQKKNKPVAAQPAPEVAPVPEPQPAPEQKPSPQPAPAAMPAPMPAATQAPEPEQPTPPMAPINTPNTGSDLIDPELEPLLPELHDAVRLAEEVDEWAALIAGMELSGLGRQLLLSSNLVKQDAHQWRVTIAPDQQSLLSPATTADVQSALQQSLDAQGEFYLEVEKPQRPTPLMVQQHINRYRHQMAVKWLQQDAGLKELEQRFGVRVDESSIKAS